MVGAGAVGRWVWWPQRTRQCVTEEIAEVVAVSATLGHLLVQYPDGRLRVVVAEHVRVASSTERARLVKNQASRLRRRRR